MNDTQSWLLAYFEKTGKPRDTGGCMMWAEYKALVESYASGLKKWCTSLESAIATERQKNAALTENYKKDRDALDSSIDALQGQVHDLEKDRAALAARVEELKKFIRTTNCYCGYGEELGQPDGALCGKCKILSLPDIPLEKE